MSLTHYRLPYDTELDEDIINWINSFKRTKKGEMVRHAIRYYMAMEGESIVFPNVPSGVEQVAVKPITQKSKNKLERIKPVMNADSLK